MEVCVDDILVKFNLASDFEETFVTLRKHDLKLNLHKCVFGVPRGRLLGYMVIKKGIKANLEKIRTI